MLNAAGLGQTIAIVDRSGKVVDTSRHLMDVFNEAKYAYRERKAEIKAARQGRPEPSHAPRPPRRAYTVDEGSSIATSRRSRRQGESKKHSTKRRHSASPSRRHPSKSSANHEHERSINPKSPASRPPTGDTVRSPTSPLSPTVRTEALDLAAPRRSSLPVIPKRSTSAAGIDMNLAYGEPPPNLFAEREEQAELKGLVGRVEGLLDEAKCLQYSVTRIIASLQKNPDAMAAVALTLAEISSLLKKMAPGAVLSLRRMAPAVFGLLSSPQFLIAAGVGVGLTVVAFGGYKIVKKIQAEKEAQRPDQLLSIQADVGRIDQWRRGVAEIEAQSVGTSVEGEFITPAAARLSHLSLDGTEAAPARPKIARAATIAGSSARSSKSAGSSRPKTQRSKSSKDVSDKKSKDKKKKGESKRSPLRLMFRV